MKNLDGPDLRKAQDGKEGWYRPSIMTNSLSGYPPKLPFVSVIIPVRNELEYIEIFLNSILEQEGIGEMEILVADGMSDDGTSVVLEQLAGREKRIRIIENRGRIVSTGLNAAIRESRGAIIVRMDAHTEYASDYIARCIASLKNTGADNVGGPACTHTNSYFQKANALAYHSSFSVGGAKFHNPDYEGYVDTVTYGCWYKETLIRLGLFDEELVRNQDDELNLRLIRSGGKIWQSPLIRSWYYPRASLRALFKQYMQYGYWKVRVIQKHRLPASIRHLVPGGFVASLLALTVLAPFFAWSRLLLAGLLVFYMCANLGASMLTCRRPAEWKYLPVMPLVFASYHFGYGWGFLRGVVDFLLLKKGARTSLTTLSR